VYDSLEEVTRPGHTALLVVDMQNDLVSLERPSAREGAPPPAARDIIPALQRLIAAGREAGVKMVYLVVGKGEDPSRTVSPAFAYYCLRESPYHGSYAGNLRASADDSWGKQVIPELAPQPEDVILLKRRLGGFWGTHLDSTLRGMGVETVVVTGTATAGCVLDTVMGAFVNDYYTLYVPDGVSDGNPKLQDLALAFFRDRFDGPTSEELSALWQAAAEKRGAEQAAARA
jgi:nicotinamidase-related amidase